MIGRHGHVHQVPHEPQDGPHSGSGGGRPATADKDGVEAIDPTNITVAGNKRYVVFKTGVNNAYDLRIVTLPVSGASGAGFPVDVAPVSLTGDLSTAKRENPSFVAHGGKWWMFLARNDFKTCDYYTDVWSSATFPATFKQEKKVSNRNLTRAAQGHGGIGLCGPGGASVYDDFGTTRIALHAYTRNNEPVANTQRDTWLGVVGWDSDGDPYID